MDAFTRAVTPVKDKRWLERGGKALATQDNFYYREPADIMEALAPAETMVTDFGATVTFRLGHQKRTSGPTLLLVGSTASSADCTWARLATLFAERGVGWATLELVGHGRSTMGELPTTTAEALACLAQTVVDAVERIDDRTNQGVVLVGHGIGGFVCMDTLLRFPPLAAHDAVVGLVLLSSAGGPHALDAGFDADDRSKSIECAGLVRGGDMPRLMDASPVVLATSLGCHFNAPSEWSNTLGRRCEAAKAFYNRTSPAGVPQSEQCAVFHALECDGETSNHPHYARIVSESIVPMLFLTGSKSGVKSANALLIASMRGRSLGDEICSAARENALRVEAEQHGERPARWTPPEGVHGEMEGTPLATLELIEGAGFEVMHEEAEEAVVRIIAWLEQFRDAYRNKRGNGRGAADSLECCDPAGFCAQS